MNTSKQISVEEGNVLIEAFWIERGGKPHLPEDISFYASDWNMLMPVVDKIEQITNNLKPDGIRLETKICAGRKIMAQENKYTKIYCYTFVIVFNQHSKIVAHAEEKLSAVWNGIIQFIQWYQLNNHGKRNFVTKKT